ncbi:MAG TPA: tryptophan synthase subunit alpha [Longimicrobiaceae bacterium]|nr:tryptophan synthase subunit alpha [Longimicrobiaceae bacterium]
MSNSTSPDRRDRLQRAFDECREDDRAALILYTTAGYPSPDIGLDVLLALADAGADVIELGVPFSDPLADGPTIQASSYRAITQGVDLGWTLDLVRRFRAERDTPMVVFSYLNPVLRMGLDAFIEAASDAGADGVLVTDLPVGADEEMEQAFLRSSLDLIRLIAPTTPPERVREIASEASGFLYYLSRTGVTGTQLELSSTLSEEVAALKAMTTVPVAVGFGVSTAEHAAVVARVADGVIVGSALVQALTSGGVEGGRALTTALSSAMRRHAVRSS